MKKILTILIIFLMLICNYGVLSFPSMNKEHKIQNINVNQFKITHYNGPEEEWNKTFGTNRWDQAVGVEQVSDGGYVIGGTKDAVDYDVEGDCFIIKTDYNGNIEWEQTYGGSNTDWCHDICATSNGGYALVGATKSYDARNIDLLIIKTDESGVEIWSKLFGGVGMDRGIAIQETSDEGFIIGGLTNSYGSNEAWLIKTDSTGEIIWDKRFCGDIQPGGYFMSVIQTINGDFLATGRQYIGSTSDIIIVKTDEDGNIIWEKLIGNSYYKDSVMDISASSDGNYILTGQILHPETEHDILLMKINDNGDEIWTRSFNETPFFDTGMSVEETSDGGYLIAGEIGTNLDNPVIYDSILIKTDNNGNIIWKTTFGGIGSDQAFEGQQTNDGGYIVVGLTESYGAADKDVWLVKFSVYENQRPNKPSRPYGETNGKTGEEYIYTTLTTDPDGDDVFYLFDWGNEMTSFILGPYKSGEECSASGIWFEKGSYEIKVKSIDENGAESDWSDPLIVSMPKNKMYLIYLFERLMDRFPLFQRIFLLLIF